MSEYAYCGLNCTTCEYRKEFNCKGCHAMKGDMSWGEWKCEIAICAINKNIEHCGKCNIFPCDTLKSFSYDKEHGDNGERIKNLENLKEKV